MGFRRLVVTSTKKDASTKRSFRRPMSPFGMSFILVYNPVACTCGVFGWQTAPTKVLVVF